MQLLENISKISLDECLQRRKRLPYLCTPVQAAGLAGKASFEHGTEAEKKRKKKILLEVLQIEKKLLPLHS
ncbi:hypothetical protein KB205_06585, partial [Microvirga sp. STS03]